MFSRLIADLPFVLYADQPELQYLLEKLLENTQRLDVDLSIGLFDHGRPATGHIRLGGNPSDGQTVTITVNGESVVYEFDNDDSVTSGNIEVDIGAAAADTATNLQTAIAASQGHVLASGQTVAQIIDVRVLTNGHTLALAHTSGVIAVQDNGEELTPATRFLYTLSRTVTAEDVTRTFLRVDTGLTAVTNYFFWVRTDSADTTAIAYDGTVTVSGGVLTFGSDGATDLAAGNVLSLIVIGTQ